MWIKIVESDNSNKGERQMKIVELLVKELEEWASWEVVEDE